MQYYIGVDGGGTKTAIASASEDCRDIIYTTTGSASWREYGVDTVVKNIKQVVDLKILKSKSTVAGIVIGLPFLGENVDGEQELREAFRVAFSNAPMFITNDVEIGWAGSLGLSPGINVVAGTGAIAYGKDEAGSSARSGGWSEFFGDEGSCYWMGSQVMRLFSKQSDGRLRKDALYDLVRSEFGFANDVDFIQLMHDEYIPQRDKVASLQILAKRAAGAGASSVMALYTEAAHELSLLVRSIRNKLNFEARPFRVSYTGGLFKSGDLIIPKFAAKIAQLGGQLNTPKFSPEEGAMLIAFSKFHPKGLTGLAERLIENRKPA